MHLGPGTRALVTGASKGIGLALAQDLAARGATVGLLARSADEALAASLPGGAGKHLALPVDVADAEAVRGAIDAFVAHAGGLDLLVANAGVAWEEPFRLQELEKAERMTQVNWLGTLYTVHHGLPHLLDAAHGHVLVISSGQALRSFPWAAVYAATKAAQRAFAEALRHELSGTGVSLTTVFPGEVATSLHDHERDALPDWWDVDGAIPASELAAAALAGVERDARSVFHPRPLRLLMALHGLSPRLTDRVLRALRGSAAAPRRD